MNKNPLDVAQLAPDYMGFIFYDKSPRNYTADPVDLPEEIKKVGVFVNAERAMVGQLVKKHKLDVVQLHGDESPGYCKALRAELDNATAGKTCLWKVLLVGANFEFGNLEEYLPVTDSFLFDTASAQRGGSGKTFNWDLLQNYPFNRPFVLSGGIGLEQVQTVKELITQGLPVRAIDVNSRFEHAPGLKDLEKLKKLSDELQR